jgi:IS605 OrfB family transposase
LLFFTNFCFHRKKGHRGVLMGKVTRIAKSNRLNSGKKETLTNIAKRLGAVRKEVWHRFGSINGVNVNPRGVRDEWVAEGRDLGVPARLWKATLRDTLADILAYREAVKEKVKRKIPQKSQDPDEQKRLYTLLKQNRWQEENWLRRQMRKHYKHGKTDVKNQIILDRQCYTAFERNGVAWLKVMNLTRGKRIAIPLNTSRLPQNTIRLILRDGGAEVHYPVEADSVCQTRPCGKRKVGIDLGYTEVATDNDGARYGTGLGQLLSRESDALKVKYQRRNKLLAIAKKKPHKAERLEKHNLGRKKLEARKRKHRANVRDKVFKGVHSLVDKAGEIVTEDLSFVPKSKNKYGRNQRRRLRGWVKGVIKQALEDVSQRRGSSLVLVNAAYTSQMDARHGVLLGQRVGKKFHCYDGVVLDAEVNASVNVLARIDDPDVGRYTPYQKVKLILLERTERFVSRMGLLIQDSSCREEPLL